MSRLSCRDVRFGPSKISGELEAEMKLIRLLGILFSMLVGAGLLFGSASQARAQVKPGDQINPDQADKVKDLVSPGTLYKVRNGMSMKIVPTERMDWPPPFKEATEKYSGQCRLSSDHRSLLGYVAGQPFPLIDPNDPEAGIKIAWNNKYRP